MTQPSNVPPRPVPPEKPLPTDCCGSGCPVCVLDRYEIECEAYRVALAEWERQYGQRPKQT